MTTTVDTSSRYSKDGLTPEADSSLLVFADDWGRHPSSCQHLIRQFLGKRPVTWVNTIGMRPPRISLSTVRRALEKLGHWSTQQTPKSIGAASPRVLNPWMWPWFSSPRHRALNRRLLLHQLSQVVASDARSPVAVTTIPIVADLIGTLPVRRWVYYCVDDFGQWPGLDGRALRAMEATLIERADLVIAVSETLCDRIAAAGRETRLLTHGIDLNLWAGGGTSLAQNRFSGLEPPLITFWGLIDRRMDISFLDRLEADLNCGTILLVGPEDDPDPALRRLGRVALRPAMPLEELPELARRSDVLIMPYADIPVTRAMQPLKLKEYLATGRPAVVRNLPSTRVWADCLDLVDSPAAFSEAVRSRVANGLPVGQGAARSRLAEESWDKKARRFERWIFDAETVTDDDRRN